MSESNAESCIVDVSTKFGINLKPQQIKAMTAFLSGVDIFVSLPTGFGKSLIYALMPAVFDEFLGKKGSIVICVSPLLSLMMDQTEKFTLKGINTEFVGEEQTNSEIIMKVLKGNVQLLYISPESLLCNLKYRNMLLSPIYAENLVALAIDEAHCIKTWGDKFRIAYAHLGDTRSLIPSTVNIMALTATATQETFRIVCQRLSLKNPTVIGCSPMRDVTDNIMLLGLKYPKTIIFVRKYADCAALYHTLKSHLGPYITYPPHYPVLQNFAIVSMYTRASKTEMKEKVLSSFCKPEANLRIVIATTAFGMGVDCADVRVIIHWGSPCSIEEYVQQSGRAGRDNLPSKAILYYGNVDKFVQQEVKDYANNEIICRRKLLFKNFLFSESVLHVDQDKSTCCDICMHL